MWPLMAILHLKVSVSLQATRDVKVAMRQNAEHVCALILRGNLEKPLVSNQIY